MTDQIRESQQKVTKIMKFKNGGINTIKKEAEHEQQEMGKKVRGRNAKF